MLASKIVERAAKLDETYAFFLILACVEITLESFRHKGTWHNSMEERKTNLRSVSVLFGCSRLMTGKTLMLHGNLGLPSCRHLVNSSPEHPWQTNRPTSKLRFVC